MTENRNSDELLDRAIEQVRDSRLTDQEIDEISGRVWQKLSQADQVSTLAVDELKPIRSCDDYQSLIPAHLEDTLSR